MTIIKISDLTELTSTPADGDQLVIVDVSESLDIDKTKKITVSNFFSGIVTALATKLTTLIYRRQGGSSVNWNTSGTTNYTPTAANIKIQTGAIPVTISIGTYLGYTDVTFPVAFTNTPMVFATDTSTSEADKTFIVRASPLSNTTARIVLISSVAGTSTGHTIHWMAIGE